MMLGPDDLPAGFRSWTTIPSVIRDNDVDTFMLEVDVNGPVNRVTITNMFSYVVGVTPPYNLHDDGQAGDRAAGDFIFTAGPFRRNLAYPLPTRYMNDANSPEGLHATVFASFEIEETNGTLSGLVLEPQVGFLRSDIPATPTTQLRAEREGSRRERGQGDSCS